MNVFSIITILIVIASLFSYINVRFLKLPNVIGLMIISLVISVAILIMHFINEDLFQSAKALVTSINFTAVVFNVMLSFLLFAGALHVDGTLLKTQSRSVAVFSFFSVKSEAPSSAKIVAEEARRSTLSFNNAMC